MDLLATSSVHPLLFLLVTFSASVFDVSSGQAWRGPSECFTRLGRKLEVVRFSRLLTVLVLLEHWTTPLSFSWPDQTRSRSSASLPSCETVFRQIDDDGHATGEIVGVERSGDVATDRIQFGQERSRYDSHNCGAAEWRHSGQ